MSEKFISETCIGCHHSPTGENANGHKNSLIVTTFPIDKFEQFEEYSPKYGEIVTLYISCKVCYKQFGTIDVPQVETEA